MAVPNIGKLQKQNQKDIFSFIDSLSVNSAAERGEDLDSDSLIEDILYNWAGDVVVRINKSFIQKGFNPKSQSGMFEPKVFDATGVLKMLTLTPATKDIKAWYWAEHGRKRGKRPPIAPLERWITYRGIDVKTVQGWQRTNDKGKIIKPYKNIKDTLKLRHIMAEAISRSIGKKGTIKRFGYKGSNYLSNVINPLSLQKLSSQLSEALGYQISIQLASAI